MTKFRKGVTRCSDDDTLIAIISAKEDFPRGWDQFFAAYNHHWDEDLVNATADRLGARGSHLGFHLPDENDEDGTSEDPPADAARGADRGAQLPCL